MSELRQNIITRDWVIIATERAKRPDQFAVKREEKIILPSYAPHCPFCLGNEEDIRLESFRISDDRGWKVRVIPNKYPALSPVGERVRFTENIHRALSGVGFHDVIVEHPRHDLTTALLSVEDIADILFTYRHRYSQIRQDPRIETVIIFKNHGESAGTSLEHPHSQLAATPVVPFQFRSRIDDAIRFFDDTGDCIFCRTIQDELTENKRILLETEHFVAFIPYAALSPFHTWIFPRRHTSSFHKITDLEISDLAYMMKMILSKLYYGLNNPDYNYTIRSSPIAEGETKYFHWYIAIVPRVTRQAGFELGSGMYINTALPEESAEFLRTFPLPLSHP
jgi:UDPglucose--hexose-1-phosphate uridylyltransferase